MYLENEDKVLLIHCTGFSASFFFGFLSPQRHNTLGDRALHAARGVCWPHSLPPPQPVTQEHIPVCYGQAGDG